MVESAIMNKLPQPQDMDAVENPLIPNHYYSKPLLNANGALGKYECIEYDFTDTAYNCDLPDYKAYLPYG